MDEKRLVSLRALVEQTCKHPPRTVERQKAMNRLIREMQKSGKLWKSYGSVKDEAEARSWLYLINNLCEATTAKAPFDPNIGLVTTWYNAYLKYRIRDLERQEMEDIQNRVHPKRDPDTREWIDPLENIPAPPEQFILAKISAWVTEDPAGQLQGTTMRKYPHVSVQKMLQSFTIDDRQWREISAELNVPVPSLSDFYQRRCVPLLRDFLASEKD